jgi:hypothetical protein
MNQRPPNTAEHDYNHNGETQLTEPTAPSDAVRVIIPSDPPVLGPAAARALLRLLIAVQRKRTAAGGASREAL